MRPPMTNRIRASSRSLRRAVFQLAARAARNRANVIAGSAFQNALLSYPYSPCNIANDRGGASATVPATTTSANSCAPIWMKQLATREANARFGKFSPFMVLAPGSRTSILPRRITATAWPMQSLQLQAPLNPAQLDASLLGQRPRSRLSAASSDLDRGF